MEGLSEILVRGPLALADTRPLRLSERDEEWVGVRGGRVGELDRPGAEGEVGVFRPHTGGLVDGVEERLGAEAFDPVVAGEPLIGGVAGGRLRIELVEPRGHDEPHQPTDVETAAAELGHEQIHQRRIRRWIG